MSKISLFECKKMLIVRIIRHPIVCHSDYSDLKLFTGFIRAALIEKKPIVLRPITKIEIKKPSIKFMFILL